MRKMQPTNKKKCFALEEEEKVEEQKLDLEKMQRDSVVISREESSIPGSRSRQSGRGYSQNFFLSQLFILVYVLLPSSLEAQLI